MNILMLIVILNSAIPFSSFTKTRGVVAMKADLKKPVKGIVQRDLTGVETRLKRSALMNYSVAKAAF
jgi:hypothetical protein